MCSEDTKSNAQTNPNTTTEIFEEPAFLGDDYQTDTVPTKYCKISAKDLFGLKDGEDVFDAIKRLALENERA